MDAVTWAKAKDLITDILKLSREEREAFLRDRCPDPLLRAEIEALLRAYDEGTDFLERSPRLSESESDGEDDEDELADLRPGTNVGPYVIVDRLGRGGMGQVFLGTDPRLHRKVALKCLISSHLEGEERRHRILHEARAAAGISHPNVATIHDVIEHDGRAFIVMEYVEGESLAARLKRERLPIETVIAIGRQLASALAAAHASGVVHRDLKPGNIQLLPDGTIKVLDFGVAKAMAIASSSAATTRTPSAGMRREAQAGTPGYMSPEQMLGHDVDERSDIFSLGIILYEMTTGRRPFPASDILSLLVAMAKQPPRADADDVRVPRELAELIAKAIAIDAADRFQSAADVERALNLTRTTRPAKRRARALTRKAVLTGLLAAGVLAVIVSAAVLASRRTITPTISAPTTVRQTVAILPLENLTKNRQTSDWPLLTQSLLAGELTGISDLAVMDPLGLNGLIEDHGKSIRADRPTLDLLRQAKVTFVVGGRIVSGDRGYQLMTAVVDTASGESRFIARAQALDERALLEAVKSLADQIASFLQVSVLQARHDQDLTPWIALRHQNIEAVKAFVEGSQFIYRRQRDEAEKYLRRAMELDPTFIAPKLWLIPALERRGRVEEAKATYDSLVALEPSATPFERAMIAYIGARLRHDTAAQERSLEVALGYSPGNNILLLRLADLRFTAGDCAGALEAMRSSIEIRWPFGALYPYWAFCSIEVGRFQDARDALAYSRRFTQSDPQELGLMEALAIAADDAENASWYGKEFVQRQAGSRIVSKQLSDAYIRIGTSCLRFGRTAAAVALFERAVAAQPDDVSYRELLAQTYDKLGNTSAAEEQRRHVGDRGGAPNRAERK